MQRFRLLCLTAGLLLFSGDLAGAELLALLAADGRRQALPSPPALVK